MAIITEDYVSFETAKLLKEKGFNEGCRAHYGTDGSFSYEKYEVEASGCEMHNAILAPTHQMVMKWLREEYNIHIEPRYFPTPNIYRYVIIRLPFTRENIDSHPQYFNSYEEAVEAGIKYCLENLI